MNNESLEVSLIENIQREDLNPIDEAQAYSRLQDEFGYGHEEIGRLLGRERSTIVNFIRLLTLPNEVKSALKQRKINAGHARALLGLGSGHKQRAVFRQIIHRGLSVRQVEALVKRSKPADKGSSRRRKVDIHLQDVEGRLREYLGTKVTITARRGRGKVILEYYSPSDLQRVIDHILK